jgi:hypothetical protein
LNKNDNADKIELIKVQNDNENKEATIKKKTSRKNKKLTKENEDFLNSLKTGSGFKIIPSSLIQQKD